MAKIYTELSVEEVETIIRKHFAEKGVEVIKTEAMVENKFSHGEFDYSTYHGIRVEISLSQGEIV